VQIKNIALLFLIGCLIATPVVGERIRSKESTVGIGDGRYAPIAADYLVGTANATLTAEIVAGTTPGGELSDSPSWADFVVNSGIHDDEYVNVTGDTMTGTLDLDGNNLDNVGVIYGDASLLAIGDAVSTDHSLATDDDLLVSGKFETGGIGYFEDKIGINLWTDKDPNELIHTADGDLRFDTYSSTNSTSVEMYFNKSDSNTPGTITQTDDGDILGKIIFRGVDNGSSLDEGAVIQVIQDGTAVSKVPTNMILYTSTGSLANTNQLVLDSNAYIGMGTATPGARCDVGGGSVTTIDGTDDLLVKDDVEIDGSAYVEGTLAATTVTGANVTTGTDPGHDHTASSITEANNLETLCTGITTTEIPIGTAANTVVYAALSGEATMDNTGAVTLADNVTVAGWTLGTSTLNVTDTADTTSYVGLWESATGDLRPKTDAGITYNAGTANLATTTFTGALSGNATTCTTASAGDAALDFFGAGVTAVTDATACTDIEGTLLSITAGTLNVTEAQTLAAVLALGADANDVDTTSWGKMEGFDAGLYLDWDADGVMNLNSDGTLELHSADWDISTTGVQTNMGNITSDGTIEGAAMTQGGQTMYDANDVPGGELGGTFASFTVDDSLSVETWTLGGGTSFDDDGITNVADIALDTISSDGASIVLGQGDENTYTQTGGTTHAFALGADAGDDFTIDTTGFVYEGDNNNVGIGTASPGTALQITAASAYVTLKNETAENTEGGAETRIIFEDHANAALAQIEASHDGTADDTKGDLRLHTHSGSALTERTRIDSTGDLSHAGDLGVGLPVGTDPSGKLHLASSNADLDAYYDTYDNGAKESTFRIRKSDTDTIGTAASTDDTDGLGQVVWQGRCCHEL